jgi:hypothetical protein
MKKLFVCVLMLVISVHICAQKISVSETDKFTKERRVETDYYKVWANMRTALYTKLWSVQDRNYITIGAVGYGSPVIGSNDKLYILTSTDSTIVCESPEIQTGNLNGGFSFKYRISVNDLHYLSNSTIKAIRVAGGRYDVDIDVDAKHRNKLKTLFNVYVKEYASL